MGSLLIIRWNIRNVVTIMFLIALTYLQMALTLIVKYLRDLIMSPLIWNGQQKVDWVIVPFMAGALLFCITRKQNRNLVKVVILLLRRVTRKISRR